MARDLTNLTSSVRDCKFVFTMYGSLGTSFYKLLAQLRVQIEKSADLENRIKLLAIMDLFLLEKTDDYDTLVNAIVKGGAVQYPFAIPNCVGDIANNSPIIPAKRFRTIECPSLPIGFFDEYEPRVSLEDGSCLLESFPSDLRPLQASVPQNFVQPNLVSAEHAVNLSNIANFDSYMAKKEAIFKSRTDFLFKKLKKLNDGVLKRTSNLDMREQRLIENRSAFDEYMLIQQQTFASEEMASSMYLTQQMNDSLSMTYSTFSSSK